MTELVNQRFADRHHHVVVIFAGVLDRPLKQRDFVRQPVAVVPLAFGERRALVQAEQGDVLAKAVAGRIMR